MWCFVAYDASRARSCGLVRVLRTLLLLFLLLMVRCVLLHTINDALFVRVRAA